MSLKRVLRRWTPLTNGVEDQKAVPEHSNDPNDIAGSWLNAFESACSEVSSRPGNPDAIKKVLDLFLPNGWWRDKLCLTWNFRTREGKTQIESFISENNALAKTGFKNCVIDSSTGLGGPTQSKEPSPEGLLVDIITFMFRFKTILPAGSGRGIIKLSPDSTGKWKAFVLFTGLESLDGHSENVERPLGHYENHTRSWKSVHLQELHDAMKDPIVLIVGGAQAGLMTAARMLKLGLRVLVIERTPRIGDRWRDRYDLLTLHVSCDILLVVNITLND